MSQSRRRLAVGATGKSGALAPTHDTTVAHHPRRSLLLGVIASTLGALPRPLVLQPAQSHLTQRPFRQIVGRIARLAGHPAR